MKCPKCGNEYMDNLAACPVCYEKDRAVGVDTDSFRYAVLGFLLPPVGLYLSKKWRDVSPVKARTVKNGAMMGFGFWAACLAAYAIVMLAATYVE